MAEKLSEEEGHQLISMFDSLEVKPKMDDPESLKRWMAAYSKGQQRTSEVSGNEDAPVKHRYMQTLRITPFSGAGDTKDITYESWKYEVKTHIAEKSYTRMEVTSAAKKSLRGEASQTIRRLGVEADLDTILRKLNGIYGIVEDSEELLKQFYAATQGEKEKVASWGCRLEDLVDRAYQHKRVHPGEVNEMLATRFWGGLQHQLKEAARVKAEHIKDFDDLRIEVRKIECEMATSSMSSKNDYRKAQVKVQAAAPEEIDSFTAMRVKINSRLDTMEETIKQQSCHADNTPRQSNEFAGYQNNFQQGNGNQHWNGPQGFHGRGSQPSNNRSRFRGRGQSQGGYRGNQRQSGNSYSRNDYNQGGFQHSNTQQRQQDDACYRCGQSGHYAIGCRADLSKSTLNMEESA